MAKSGSRAFRTIANPGAKQGRFSGHPSPAGKGGSGHARVNQATNGRGSGVKRVNQAFGSNRKRTPYSSPTD